MGDEEMQEIVEEEPRSRNKHSLNPSDVTRLFLNVGKNQRILAKDILGAIAGETGVRSKFIGNIDVYDKYTFVDVDKNKAREIIEKMKNRKIKGNKLNIERANRSSRSRRKK